MPDVLIYTTPYCPYCRMAKSLLTKKNVAYKEVDVSDSTTRAAMRARSGGRNSVPQIFIGASHVGGCDDLHDLEHEGKLDPMLVTA